MNNDQIQVTATFPSVAAADLPEFKKILSVAIERTAKEAGTLQYDWFSNAEGTQWVMRETYANSDAQLAHIENCGDLIGEFVRLGGGLVGDIFGTPTPKLMETLDPFSPNYFKPFQAPASIHSEA